ncbi:MAG: arginine--tRNA ligase [Spirochaetales bacterium]|nr:arginine--tRNA ligase [Spirochaetales bacterium]
MRRYQELWKHIIREQVEGLAGQPVDPQSVVLETPPRPELGEIAFPMFPFARVLRRAPAQIAQELAARLAGRPDTAHPLTGRAEAQGPYLNVHLDRREVAERTVGEILQSVDLYGHGDEYRGQRVVVEFSAPNTNKPLHLGHLRNDAIGMATARILEEAGAEVLKVNLINDRGIHICKSMLAYQQFGGGVTPEQLGQKGDHLVGDYYVRFAAWAKEDPRAEERAREMLAAWEQGEPQTRALWETMNRWAIEGITETYRATGVSFDRIYRESDTYLLGRQVVLEGVEGGIFQRDPDGSVWVDLSAQGLDRKVLLRSDGTSLYVTQDIGTAVQRHHDWPFDQMIYVVGNEQRHHFQVLFEILAMLGHEWARNLHHLAYGMVNLPEGKMKSREGTVVDADDLIESMEALAIEEIREKGREAEIEDLSGAARKIALGALHFYLLQPSPYKDMIFDPKESISFLGSTGPYLQYTGARISSMLRKFGERRERFAGGSFRPELLKAPEEWEILKRLSAYPDTVLLAARELNPSVLTAHLYELARAFSQFWHEHPVLQNEDADLVVSRISLARSVRQVLYNGMRLIGVPFLERM